VQNPEFKLQSHQKKKKSQSAGLFSLGILSQIHFLATEYINMGEMRILIIPEDYFMEDHFLTTVFLEQVG
jgi:hypothetical protein